MDYFFYVQTNNTLFVTFTLCNSLRLIAIIMSRPYFSFKQFTIFHDKCAMKVGTDGVLLGAWTATDNNCSRILDIGTGSGLIAIMLAQRTNAQIVGIDIDSQAVSQATENAIHTPWAARLHFLQENVLDFTSNNLFDLIVCNPPFYANALQSPVEARTLARHSSALPLDKLIEKAAQLLTNNGTFSLILPSTNADNAVMQAWTCELNLQRKCLVAAKPALPPKRTLLAFGKGNAKVPSSQRLNIRNADGSYSEEYVSLTRPYYLNL